MYATNDNLQAIASRNRIKDALLNLMHQYPYKEITITQICQESQMVRQTFYRNFDSKNDVMKYLLDELILTYFGTYYNEKNTDIQLINFYNYMLLNKDLLLLMLSNNLLFMIDRSITSNITKLFNIEQLSTIKESDTEKYVIGFIASTICSILSIWINDDFKNSPEVMCELTKQFLSGLKNISSLVVKRFITP